MGKKKKTKQGNEIAEQILSLSPMSLWEVDRPPTPIEVVFGIVAVANSMGIRPDEVSEQLHDLMGDQKNQNAFSEMIVQGMKELQAMTTEQQIQAAKDYSAMMVSRPPIRRAGTSRN